MTMQWPWENTPGGGMSSLELQNLYTDPMAFIQYLIGANSGNQSYNSALNPRLAGQADYLYALSSLLGLADPQNSLNFGGPELTATMFNEYSRAPASQFRGSLPNVLQLLGQARPELEAGAAQRQQQNPENSAEIGFNDIFNQIAALIAPNLSPGLASSRYSQARRDAERARYNAAVANGTFGGTVWDWLDQGGFV